MKKITNYSANRYPCQVIVNNRWFTEIEISQYYKTKKGRSTVSDEKIRELVSQLKGKFIRDNEYFSSQPLYIVVIEPII